MLDDMKFRHLLYICGRDVALAMKRLRKSARGHIRFLLVSERHKSGVPHFHMLVHERVPNAVTHRLLKDAWRQGFSDFKLADPVSPGYVAKYISKDATALVRASLHYGESSAFSVRLAAPNPSLTEGSGGVSREKLSLGK